MEVSKKCGYILVHLDNPTLRLHRITLRHMNYFFPFRFPTYQLPPRPTLAFCARRDSAHKKEKRFFTMADPYIDAWMLITGNNREVFEVTKLIRLYPDVEQYIVPCRRMLKCRVMSDRCPVVKAKNMLENQRTDESQTILSKPAVVESAGKVKSDQPLASTVHRSEIVVKRTRRSVRQRTGH